MYNERENKVQKGDLIMWSNGTIGIKNNLGNYVTIKYWCKHFEEPGKFGIENGRISKLTLQQGNKEVYNYDRGLDIGPQTEEAEQALAILMHEYN